MSVITICTSAHDQVVDITKDVAVLAAKMSDGVCSLFVQHTTCALTILTSEEGMPRTCSGCFSILCRRRPFTSTTRPNTFALTCQRARRAVCARCRCAMVDLA